MNEANKELTLDLVQKATSVEVVEIQGGWGVRQRLNQMGIHVGDKMVMKRSGIMGGPILIQVHGMEVALGRGMAHKVLVVEKG
jgi:ferrous iron transport protein A